MLDRLFDGTVSKPLQAGNQISFIKINAGKKGKRGGVNLGGKFPSLPLEFSDHLII